MIWEMWCTGTFDGVLLHVKEFVLKNNIQDVRSFSVQPLFDEELNDIVSYQAVLYYMKDQHYYPIVIEKVERTQP